MKKISAKRPRGSASVLKNLKKSRMILHHQLFLLTGFMEEWYRQNVDTKDNERFQDPEYLLERWKQIRHKVLGGPGYGDGYLQDTINKLMGDILKTLREDIPYIPETEYYAYSYFIAGFDNRMVAHLLGLPSDKMASSIKSRLKDEFLRLQSDRKFEYLEVLLSLPFGQLPNCQRNAIFA